MNKRTAKLLRQYSSGRADYQKAKKAWNALNKHQRAEFRKKMEDSYRRTILGNLTKKIEAAGLYESV
jgi:hypothetical protein